MDYIWYNADLKKYQIGKSSLYKVLKRTSTYPSGFTLLYKLKPSLKKLGHKLIDEMNKVRIEDRDRNIYEFDVAS